MSVTVHPEQPGDVAAVRDLVAAAFAGPRSDAPRGEAGPSAAAQPREVALLESLRADRAAWMPRFSMVAVDPDGTVVGFATCSRAHVSMASLMAPALVLEPVAVAPGRQHQGIGTALVEKVVAEARLAGETLVVAVGDPAFFRRSGFVPADDLGLIGPGTGPAFQALALAPDHPVGDVSYPYAFTAP